MERTGRNTHKFSARYGRRHSAATILITTHLLSLVPAVLLSCEETSLETPVPEKTQIYIHKIAKTTAGTLDLFFFNDDALLTLDAYQRFEDLSEGVVEGASRTGDKLVAGILNRQGDIWSWSDINSFQRLSERISDLTEDRTPAPVMTGLVRIRAGKDRRGVLELKPLLTRISLHSLCCDFHARPYKDAVLEDVKVYLVNINRTVSFFDDGSATVPASWLNMGGLENDGDGVSLGDVSGMILPDAAFYCYPNSTVEESLGRPLTRLVIEGTLLGERYYYPVNLPAIGRAEDIVLDVTITRTGTSDPDSPAGTGTVLCGMTVRPWDERTPWQIPF